MGCTPPEGHLKLSHPAEGEVQAVRQSDFTVVSQVLACYFGPSSGKCLPVSMCEVLKYGFQCCDEADDLMTVLASQMFVIVGLYSWLWECTRSAGVCNLSAHRLLNLVKDTLCASCMSLKMCLKLLNSY